MSYKELIGELWKTDISSADRLDKLIKKLIANVNIGLLERTGSTDQKSVVFKISVKLAILKLSTEGKYTSLRNTKCQKMPKKRRRVIT